MIIRIEPAVSAAAQTLIAELDADLYRRYPAESVHGISSAGFEESGGFFAVGYEDDVPVACGAIRPFEGLAEIKRVFVVPSCRGRGFAKAMMAFLEAEAARRGFARAVLETGCGQPEALALYRALGWRETARFGEYVHDPRSICFAKEL